MHDASPRKIGVEHTLPASHPHMGKVELRSALEIQEKWSSEPHLDLNEAARSTLHDVDTQRRVSLLYEYATVLRRLGRDTEAAPFFSRAIALAEKPGLEEMGKGIYSHSASTVELFRRQRNSSLAGLLTDYAALLQSLGRETETEPLYQRAIALFDEFGGSL
jgi:predicted RNA polymerase sigma factor